VTARRDPHGGVGALDRDEAAPPWRGASAIHGGR
jgi:hypothetical protein